MKKITVLFLLLPLLSFGQFKINEVTITEGAKFAQGKYKVLETIAVVEKEGTAQELYQKTLDWINVTYKSPEDVIKSKIKGEYLKIKRIAKL